MDSLLQHLSNRGDAGVHLTCRFQETKIELRSNNRSVIAMSKTELNSKWFFENLIPNLLTAFGDRMTGIAEIYGFDIAGDGGG